MQYVGGNRLTLLRNGEQYFPALLAAIDAAKSEVCLESYIYADDQTGSLVTDTLARAAARGARLRLLLDGFGARDFPARWRHSLRAAGAEVLVFRPEVASLRPRRGRLRRMHRKLACIDGQVAFCGGINLIDDFRDPTYGSLEQPRFDLAVRVGGPLVADVHETMTRLWLRIQVTREAKRFDF